ncbi:MAG TPA: prepilin-type N-terminal cleavage/methylation domain-containing protein [Candidatus Binatia bacterium]|nr:prepilin-type N-terminal cleavage/methylation domain-containing protein [Candidatus Binatia bacterium]
MNVRDQPRIDSGLTLLELMVAIAIFSVVGTAIYSTFVTAITTRDYATERSRRYAHARNAMDRLEQDLRGSFDSQLRGNVVPPRLRAPLADDSMLGDERLVLEMTTVSARGVIAPEAFLATPQLDEVARLTTDRGDQAHVRWVIDENGDLLRYELRPVRAETIDWTIAPFEIVARDVDVHLEFYDRTQWLRFWDSNEPGDQQHRVPMLVRTQLETTGVDEQRVTLVSSVVIPMALEAATRGRGPLFPSRTPARGGKNQSGTGSKSDDDEG